MGNSAFTTGGAFNLPVSSIRRKNSSGVGSTQTTVLRYLTAEQSEGSDIEYIPSTVNGDSFKVKVDGIYSVSVVFYSGTAQGFFINADTAIQPYSISAAYAKIGSNTSASLTGQIAWTGKLNANDVIWITVSASQAGSVTYPELNKISVCRVV